MKIQWSDFQFELWHRFLFFVFRAKYEWQEPYMDGSLTIGSENNEECTSYSPSIAYTTNKVPFIEGLKQFCQKKIINFQFSINNFADNDTLIQDSRLFM